VGFTRHGLLTPTYAAANEVLASAPAALRRNAPSAAASPTSGDSTSEFISSRTSRASRAGDTEFRTARYSIIAGELRPMTLDECARDIPPTAIGHVEWSSRALLLPCAGRHALDEPVRVGSHGQACR
jgi:hypothetical protein